MQLKKYAVHLLAVVVFVAITVIQFSPLFKGKVINQSDITQYRGMSREAIDFRNTAHQEALWTNSMFGGMPAYQVSTLYPGNWMPYLDRLVHLFLPHPSGYIFMGFLGFFILLLCLEINPWLALVGSLAYGFSSYFFIILEVGHNSKANALSYLPPVMGSIILLMKGRYRLGFALATLFMALELNANHVQITYYGFLVFALVFASYFFSALKQKTSRAFFTGLGLFALASTMAVLPNAANLLATYEYGHYTTRGPSELTIGPSLQSNKSNATSGLDKDYATQYSYGIDETFTLLIPNFKGGITAPISYRNMDALKKVDPEMREQVGQVSAYFGDQSITAGPVYVGAIVILLAFLGLFIIRHPLKWPLVIATILSVMLGWGKHFMGFSSLFMDYLPGYNKFRAVSMTLVIAEFTLPLLAVLALDKWISAKGKEAGITIFKKTYSLKQLLAVSALVIGGFCLLGLLVPDMVNTFTATEEREQIARNLEDQGATNAQVHSFLPVYMDNVVLARQSIFKSDALRSLIFIVLAGACLFLYRIEKIKPTVLFSLLGVLVVADLWPVATRYLNERSFVSKAQFEAPLQKTAADERILADKNPDYRVLNLTVLPFQDATTSYYHKSIGGYHGAKLKKYDELISFHLFKEISRFSGGLKEAGTDSLIDALTAKLQVLNMLNTRYIILPTRDGPATLANQHANGNAWFVKEVKTVSSADSEMVGLYRLDTKHQALIQQKNKPAGLDSNYDGEGSITLSAYKPNDLVYETETKNKGFAVFSEIYYPKGWNAYLDGALTPHYCVDYLLRGMALPAGRHRVEFKFEPAIYKTGNSIALAGSLLVLAAILGGIYFAVKKDETGLAG